MTGKQMHATYFRLVAQEHAGGLVNVQRDQLSLQLISTYKRKGTEPGLHAPRGVMADPSDIETDRQENLPATN